MKKLLIMLCILTCSSMYAQTPISVGVFTSLDFTGSIASYPIDKPWFGYQAGLRLRYDIMENTSIIAGVSQQNIGTYSDFKNMMLVNVAPNKKPIDAYYHIKVTQIPVLFSKYFGDKYSAGTTIGLAYNIINRVNATTRYYINNQIVEENTTRTSNNSSQFVTALFGLGFKYKFNHFDIALEPNFGYQLFGVNSYNHKYWHVGIGVAAFYRIE